LLVYQAISSCSRAARSPPVASREIHDHEARQNLSLCGWDAWIGAILGGFTGGVPAVAILLFEFEDAISSSFGLILASMASGALSAEFWGFASVNILRTHLTTRSEPSGII
jgi:hypothetical protein